ncbi:MAG: hypothetical protein ACYTGG_05785 [Planctomycetota bacterium]|jgi:4-hydroxybenzoate polyprenyltransferase
MRPRARGVVSRVMAASFALCAFAVAIVAGMASEQATAAILLRALLAMIVCYPVGFLGGMICEKVVDEHIDAHEKQAEDLATTGDAVEAHESAHASDADEVITV